METGVWKSILFVLLDKSKSNRSLAAILVYWIHTKVTTMPTMEAKGWFNLIQKNAEYDVFTTIFIPNLMR